MDLACLSSCSRGDRPLVELSVEPAGFSGRCTGVSVDVLSMVTVEERPVTLVGVETLLVGEADLETCVGFLVGRPGACPLVGGAESCLSV